MRDQHDFSVIGRYLQWCSRQGGRRPATGAILLRPGRPDNTHHDGGPEVGAFELQGDACADMLLPKLDQGQRGNGGSAAGLYQGSAVGIETRQRANDDARFVTCVPALRGRRARVGKCAVKRRQPAMRLFAGR